uniref:Uncharacterized protein n=1 Tax=Tetranychus urticae TaxID=32264 RepID=T1L1C7_TETUR
MAAIVSYCYCVTPMVCLKLRPGHFSC